MSRGGFQGSLARVYIHTSLSRTRIRIRHARSITVELSGWLKMACCRCNRSGRCLNCRCVKSGSFWHGCLPQRLGQCANTDGPQLSQDMGAPQHLNSQSANVRRSLSTTPSPTPTSSLLSPTLSTNTQLSSANLLSTTSITPVTVTRPPFWSAPEFMSPELPTFSPVADAFFSWGPLDSSTFVQLLNAAYDEVVHWKPNLFRVPYGKAGKSFVSELARLYKAFASVSAMECIAMKATVVLPILMLQKPSSRSNIKEHIICLERRLTKWFNGDLEDLLLEGRTIQVRIPRSNVTTGPLFCHLNVCRED